MLMEKASFEAARYNLTNLFLLSLYQYKKNKNKFKNNVIETG